MKKPFSLLISLLALTTMACGVFGFGSTRAGFNGTTVTVMTNTSLTPWLEQAANEFNQSNAQTDNGRNIFIEITAVDAGQAITEIGGETVPDMWIPDETVWVNLLADQGNSSYQGNCVSIAESPLVIGMWRDVAESLGWPGLPLGWLDIGSLATDSNAWRYYSGGEFGNTLRLGHTHPGLSGTGASTLLAVVQAAQSVETAVTTADIEQPIVQASVGAFESGVAIFSTDSATLGQEMQTRGAQYLSAGIMHESTLLQNQNENLVPIYPLEGTFIADHPACVSSTADAEQQDGAQKFRDYLLTAEAQTSATSFGLRPVNGEATIQAPLTEQFGVDLNQPQIVFGSPSVETIYAIQDLWQSARKDVNLVMLLDVSGSMRGSKMRSMLSAATQFVEQMGEDDFISVIAFSSNPTVIANHERVGDSRGKVINAINSLEAFGDTSLYDAIGNGAALIQATGGLNTTDALVVLTDGEDTFSYQFSPSSAAQAALESEATVFTIAYGRDADTNTLTFLANEANGNFYEGDEASIADIYEEMSAAFGGSVGFGR